MAISKLKFLQEKKTALTKQQRRQLADLLSAGKESSAKIRVENIIRDDIYIELLEFLELYCELLLARISIILDTSRHEVDPNLKEAVSSVIYSCHHTEVKELITLGDLFKHRYGPEFAAAVQSNTDGEYVPEKIVKRCAVDPPSEVLVDFVPYSGLKEEPPKLELSKDEEPGSDSDSGSGGGLPEAPIEAEFGQRPSVVKQTAPKPPQSEFDELKARFAALKK
ncbi:hypothetical protein CXQ85_004828 [Candidozyma haemuli]|uniref:Vacuolar protein sorting-associated protein IST1 n=1 Tax=Candidozyma haemuli TaxID=45357 RepID=A0A2V1AWC3_9ASCO|nr:hypothetical protein CXQ85_004828 [[Candida] haemuloni]PVH22158.1 hypothetical protein CXQ85_004828 [[Candida] haemuloni]